MKIGKVTFSNEAIKLIRESKSQKEAVELFPKIDERVIIHIYKGKKRKGGGGN